MNAPTPLPITLDSVKEEFQHWRATRGKRGRIPGALWALAESLTNQYSHNEIASALSVNHTQLKKQLQRSQSSQNERVAFVECALPPQAPEIQTRILEFMSKKGFPIKISGIPTAEMMSIVSMLMGN